MFHLTASLLVSGTGETFRNITAGAASVATLLAVFIGGIWAWFKFIRGRTFQPRIAIELLGQWRAVVDDAQAPRSGLRRHRPKSHVLHVRVRVTNIGAGKVMLRQYYTALYVSFLRNRESALPGTAVWENYLAALTDQSGAGAFEVFKEHDWIEPQETVTDDLLLDLGRRPEIAKLELDLAWNSSWWRWHRRWKTWRRVHRRVLYPRCFLRNLRRRIYQWCQRKPVIHCLLRPVATPTRWLLRPVSWFARRRRRFRLKLRRRICRARLYSWIYRPPDDPRHRKDVADFVRRIIPPGSTMIDDDA